MWQVVLWYGELDFDSKTGLDRFLLRAQSPAVNRIRSWFDQKLKIGVYELQGPEIVRFRGLRAGYKIPIAEITSWRIFPEMGFDVVEIRFIDETSVRWTDMYNDLIAILRKVAPDKERNDRG